MAEPILCPHCKKPVRAEAKMCPNCGRPLKKICVVCNEGMPVSDNFCPKCGARQVVGSGAVDVLSRLDAEKAVKVGQGVGGCLLAPLKFIIQTFIGAGPIGWIALLLLPIGLVLCSVVNNLTRGLAGQILIVWPIQMLAGSVLGACLLPLFFGLIVLMIFFAFRKKWFQRLVAWVEAKGRQDRSGYLAVQARKAEERRQKEERKRQEAERKRREAEARRRAVLPPAPVQSIAPPPPGSMPESIVVPPATAPAPQLKNCPKCGKMNRSVAKRCQHCGANMYTTRAVSPQSAKPPAPVEKKFDQKIIDAQTAMRTLQFRGDRTRAEQVVREAIANLEAAGNMDFSARVLKDAVDAVLVSG